MKGTLAVLLLVAAVCVGHVLAADRQLAFALQQRNLGYVEKLFWERSDPNHTDYGKYALLTLQMALRHSSTAMRDSSMSIEAILDGRKVWRLSVGLLLFPSRL